jgi:hypothetical protein
LAWAALASSAWVFRASAVLAASSAAFVASSAAAVSDSEAWVAASAASKARLRLADRACSVAACWRVSPLPLTNVPRVGLSPPWR